MRPEAISNRVRLSNEARAAMRRLVAEDGAVDAALATVVDELSPHEASVSILAPEDDFLAGANEQLSFSSVCVLACGVVSLIQFQAVFIAIFGKPPKGCLHADSTRNSVPELYCVIVVSTRYSDYPQ
jgi:hypothetical protein